MQRPTNELWSRTKNQVSLSYFTGQPTFPLPPPTEGPNKPAELHSLIYKKKVKQSYTRLRALGTEFLPSQSACDLVIITMVGCRYVSK